MSNCVAVGNWMRTVSKTDQKVHTMSPSIVQ